VPPRPARAVVRTGDRVRVRVVCDREGFVTVFNIGPTGNPDVLYPAGPPERAPAGAVIDAAAADLCPPAVAERLFAVWSRTMLPLSAGDLRGLVGEPDPVVSRAYRATRDMKVVQSTVRRLRPGRMGEAARCAVGQGPGPDPRAVRPGNDRHGLQRRPTGHRPGRGVRCGTGVAITDRAP
jgi:hypothetical protein